MSLGASEDGTPTSSFDQLESLLESSLGAPVQDLFAAFDQNAMRRSFFTQWHDAVTLDGDEVMVALIRPEIRTALHAQLDALSELQTLWLPEGDRMRADMPAMLAEFRADLAERLDQRTVAEGLRTLASALVDEDALTVAEPVSSLCSRDVLTVRRIPGRFVDSLRTVAPGPADVGPDPRDAPRENEASEPDDDIARQLCLAWMQQALFGTCYPAHARAEHVMFRDDGRFAIVGGGISRLSLRSRTDLLDYLAAASRHDPELAAVLLSRQMTATPGSSRDSLRLAFRQAEPFRDGGWIADYAGQRLAHDLFVHWRLARRSGFDQSPHLRSFCRGLAELEETTRTFAPSRDSFRQGLDDIRAIAAAVSVRELVGPTHLITNLERLLPAGQEVLHRLNEISLDVNQGTIHLSRLDSEKVRAKPSRERAELLLSLILMMSAVALATPRLASIVPHSWWPEPLGVTLFLALAAVFFRCIRKRGER